MVKIQTNNNINIVAGDSFKCKLFINKGTKLHPSRYELTEMDTIIFTLVKDRDYAQEIITKRYTLSDVDEKGNVVINIESTDTEFLPTGIYYYSVKLEHIDLLSNEKIINTIIPFSSVYVEA
jgi:hypothetical protein